MDPSKNKPDPKTLTSWLGEAVEKEPGVFVGVDGAPPVPGSAMPAATFGEIEEITTVLWSPQPADAPDWKAEQIHLHLKLKNPDPSDKRPPIVLVFRMKTEPAARKVIEGLVRCYKDAFGLRNF